MNKYFLLIIILITIIFSKESQACHKGGPLGIADKKPVFSTTDLTFQGTFMFASTSGTSGCKNWDFIQLNQNRYIAKNWVNINENVAKGEGEYIIALSKLMKCPKDSQRKFINLLHNNYSLLYNLDTKLDDFERTHHYHHVLISLIKRTELAKSCA